MTDLTDALATCRTMWQSLSDEGWEYDPELADLETVMAAARSVADADEMWWCETHESTGTPPHCRWWINLGSPGDCQMVRRSLLKPEGHK